MSLFRVLKYSSLIFFFNKYRGKIFRVIAVALFAAVTSILYQDVADYLQLQYPGTVIYALIAKILVVYGALIFVLWQFRPEKAAGATSKEQPSDTLALPVQDRLSVLEDVADKEKLQSRYERILAGKSDQSD
jgi:hypothetical protein